MVLAFVIFSPSQSQRIETKTVDPEQVCIDLADIGFSSKQECIDFVQEMIVKIKDYSQTIDCDDHELLIKKLGVECS